MVALVIAEHNNKTLKTATLNTVSAALACSNEVHILVVGYRCDAVVKAAAQINGVTKVVYTDAPYLEAGLPENLCEQILLLASHYTHLLAPAVASGRSVMPRVAAKLDVAQISDIVGVLSVDTFERPIYAGNAIATVKSGDPVKVLTVRPTAFDTAAQSGTEAPTEALSAAVDTALSTLVSCETVVSSRPDLTAAKVVISGGRGLGSGENYSKLIEPLADKLGAALGASRAAVDAGFVPNEYQVGQTGKIVAPQLYVAIGISGAIQHLAGMMDSKVIVAINKDPDAPIFGVSDYGLVGDLFEVVPELTKAL